jgi:hypothetical protein
VQLHTLVAAHTLYLLDLGFKTPAPWREEEVVREVVAQTPPGRISLFMAAGRVGGMGSKYGIITENMRYPTFAQVCERDLLTLATVGEMVWRNLLGPKAIILVELRAA